MSLNPPPPRRPLSSPGAEPPYSTQTTTRADYRALALKAAEVKRARGMAARTPSERTAYRQGYLAAAKYVSRLRQLLRAAEQGLQP